MLFEVRSPLQQDVAAGTLDGGIAVLSVVMLEVAGTAKTFITNLAVKPGRVDKSWLFCCWENPALGFTKLGAFLIC